MNYPLRVLLAPVVFLLLGGLASCEAPTSAGGAEQETPPQEKVVAARLDVQGSGQTADTEQPLPEAIVATVVSNQGKPMQGVLVRATAPGSVEPAEGRTGADGKLSFRWTLGPSAGTQQMELALPEQAGFQPVPVQATAREPRPALTRIDNFVPGGEARLVGTALRRVSSLSLDGTAVALRVDSDTSATFAVPVLRRCETDGRKVRLLVNDDSTLAFSAPLRVENTVTLAVGESRLLDGADLSCLALPAADQDFVLTAVSFSREGMNTTRGSAVSADTLLSVRTWTESPLPPSTSAAQGARRISAAWAAALSEHVAAAVQLQQQLGTAPYSDNPVLFDPKYATAQVGDTVRFVDWQKLMAAYRNGGPYYCTVPREEAPWYPVVVAAVRGRTVIGVDLRRTDAQTLLSDTWLQRFDTVASIAEAVALPTMRAVFDRDFQPPAAAGGRHFSLMSSFGGGRSSDGMTGGVQASCPLASEVTTTLLSLPVPEWSRNLARAWASTIVHEYAHNADGITATRLTGNPRRGISGGQFVEAWAMVAEETASRIASGQPTRARLTVVEADAGATRPVNYIWSTAWGRNPERATWTDLYGKTFSLLMYLRERYGDAALDHAGPRLFQGFAAAATYDGSAQLDLLASLLGARADELLDAWALASATHGLVASEAARAAGLPQMEIWDLAEYASRTGPRYHSPASDLRVFGRRANVERAIAVGPGAYAALYLMADEDRGVSLQVTDRRGVVPSRLRLTRVR